MEKPRTPLSDPELISQILEGNSGQFAQLVRRHNQLVYRVLRSYLKDETEIEDTMQNTYLKAFEHLNQFNSKSRFSTWLVRIGINEALQSIKRKQTKNGRIEETERIPETEAPLAYNPEYQLLRTELRQVLEYAVDLLPEKYRLVFILREVEGTPHSEIGRMLDISEVNVKVRLFRAKSLIKQNLRQQAIHGAIFEFGNSRCDAIVAHVMEQISLKKSSAVW